MSKKTKKAMSMLLVVALIAVIAIGGMLAYLTSDDSDVNVMTLGNVEIEQIEQEWNADKTALVDFTQEKPLYPYVGSFGWENKDSDDGAYRRFTMNNVVDKYVSVKNTGKSPAYVRTFIALEMGEYDYNNFNMVGVSINKINGDEFKYPGTWQWTDDFVAEIDGKNYNVMVAVHENPVNPEETTIPSLLQVYLSKDATNEVCEKLDGNGNGTYDILVYSEAVQTEGFDNAIAALDTAFGDTTAPTYYHPWNKTILVSTAAELRDAMKEDGNEIVLTKDIIVGGNDTTGYGQHMFLANGKSATVDLNGFNITVAEDATQVGSLFSTANGGTIDIIGDGNVEIKNGKAFVAWSMNDTDQINVYGGNYSGNGHEGNNALMYVQAGKIDVYGGTFTYPVADNDNWGFNARDGIGNKVVIVIHEGTLLQHEAFQYGDNSRIQLEEGCELKEVTIDGETWYQVVKK